MDRHRIADQQWSSPEKLITYLHECGFDWLEQLAALTEEEAFAVQLTSAPPSPGFALGRMLSEEEKKEIVAMLARYNLAFRRETLKDLRIKRQDQIRPPKLKDLQERLVDRHRRMGILPKRTAGRD